MSEDNEIFSEEIEDPTRDAHWAKIWFLSYLQIFTVYGMYIAVTKAYLLTSLFCLSVVWLGVIGVNAGAHRLWAHRSYTASLSLKIFLMLCHTLIGQGSIYDWVKYHRLHHEQFGTSKDPFNPSKGFFYSHFWCITQKRTKEQEDLANNIDMSDLQADPVVMFQKKYYLLLYAFFVILLPLYIPMKLWQEDLVYAIFVGGLMRYGLSLHLSWLIHSATTILGLKKGERYPSDTNMVFLVNKTFWLHYHYMVPWDYQTSEYVGYGSDLISKFIRVCAALEYATDLRTIDSDGVKEALEMCLENEKSISDCLLEVHSNSKLPKDHYLKPSKFYNF